MKKIEKAKPTTFLVWPTEDIEQFQNMDALNKEGAVRKFVELYYNDDAVEGTEFEVVALEDISIFSIVKNTFVLKQVKRAL